MHIDCIIQYGRGGGKMTLTERLEPFRAAGMLDTVPSHDQIRQGEWEMAPYVVSADATREDLYKLADWGNPWLRQPLIFSQIGLDHLRIGTGLQSAPQSICTHLLLTWHQGMPAWDLQILQTHPGGLDMMHEAAEALLDPQDPAQRRLARLANKILPDAAAYQRQLLGQDGWIERARRLDYPDPDGTDMPPEFADLVSFLKYVRRFPEVVPWHRWPLVATRNLGRRMRSGRGMGWLAPLPPRGES
jgi:hypothetical protein